MNSIGISVIMPVHNEQEYVTFAIESILNQTFSNFEFIIVDDGSTDGTLSVIRSFDDSRIRLVENRDNVGLAGAINNGLNYATGKYIARMDGDDICHPNRLHAQFNFLETHNHVAIVGSSMYLINDENRILSASDSTERPEFTVNGIISNGVPASHPTVMMRRQVINQADGYRDVFKRGEDLDLWLRLSEKLPDDAIYNIPRRYVYYRVDGSQLFHKTGKNRLYREAAISAAKERLEGKNEKEVLHDLSSATNESLEKFPTLHRDLYLTYDLFRREIIAGNMASALKRFPQIQVNIGNIHVFLRLLIADVREKLKSIAEHVY
jgi:glycosyltransferase involved in cell wall biosynthesis